MAVQPTADERRRESVRHSFTGVATALLRDRQPAEEDFGLLCIAIVDAIVAGDRELLSVVPMVAERWRRYAPAGAGWRSEFEARLGTIEMVSIAGVALLGAEHALSRRD